MTFKDVDEAFAKLIIDEDHGVGRGIPRMKAVDQTLDIAYLKGKLRLYCRTLLYIRITGESNVDLKKEDFPEVFNLLKRKDEYLAIDIALFLFIRLSRLLTLPQTEMSLGNLKEYLNLYNLHADRCSSQERIELLSMPSSFLTYLSNKGRKEFIPEGILLYSRVAYMQYRAQGKRTKAAFLNPSVFRLVTCFSRLTVPRERLLEINYVVNWPMDKVDFTVSDWVKEFSRIYSPYLDPKARKPYRDIYKVLDFFLEEEYFKAIKILENLRFPDSNHLNLEALRYLYYCVFSLYYHGNPAERKNIHRRKLSPHLLLDRCRKRLEYYNNKEGKFRTLSQHHQSFLTRMQAIQKAYDLVYRSTPPANVREKLTDYFTSIRQSIAENARLIETPWMEAQVALLEQELERMGL